MDKYDVGIIGMGVAGVFATLKIAKEYKDMKTICFDVGRPAGKRKRQCDGFLGCFPSSDGKLYINDISNISNITSPRKTKTANTWVNDYISDFLPLKITNDKSPSINTQKRIKKSGFDIKLNDYIQLYPKDIHMLSKHISNILSNSKNISMNFDNEVLNITKEKKSFIITTSEYKDKIECKNILICTGRSGWRWTKQLYEQFGIIESNDIANFGIRIEASSSVMKDFNKSNCSLNKNNISIGPLCWNGTVIPEDHIDFAISSFRSNEARWKSDKVSFNLFGQIPFKNNGFEQTSRMGQLTFILTNDRIIKEKISLILSKKSKISIIPEYDWLIAAINEIGQFMPDITTKGYFHIPTILPLIPKINIDNNLSTDIDGLYCAGEASGQHGILAAIVSGLIAADSIGK